MSGKELVEGLEVRRLLIVHVGHQRAKVRVTVDDRGGLRGVDESCGKLAGLVDAELRECVSVECCGSELESGRSNGVRRNERGKTYCRGEEVLLLLG